MVYLQRETGLFADEQAALLQFAPERAVGDRLSSRSNVRYESADVEPGLAMHVMDMTRIPREEASFDYVLASHVLEHIPDDRAAMAELFRVLRPGGRALLQHPVDYRRDYTFEDSTLSSPHERLAAFGQNDHVRIYGRDLADRLMSVGFEVNVRRFREELSFDDRRYFCLEDGGDVRGDDIYECLKRPMADSSTRETVAVRSTGP